MHSSCLVAAEQEADGPADAMAERLMISISGVPGAIMAVKPRHVDAGQTNLDADG